MNPKFRLVLYLALGIALTVCVRGFMSTARGPGPARPGSGTNAPVSTNLAATPVAGATNANAGPVGEDGQSRKPSERMGRMMGFGVVGFFALVGLSVLIGYDVSRYFADRFEELIFNDDLKGVRDPDYGEAEEAWKRGDHLDAIQLMRDFYKKHPREAHVALRIAEIYESDLGNYLAAALEYEEVLKKRLPPERWAWAAVHLVNLYSGKLNKTDAATKLLHRIVDEYGQTAAAKKARERLGIPEPVAPPEPAPEPETTTPQSSQEPPPNLPPGFRPK